MYALGLGAEFLAASFQKDDADRWRSICARCSAALSRLAPSRPRALRRLAGSRSSPQQTTDFRRTMAKVCKSGGEGTFAERHGNGEVAQMLGIGGHLAMPPLPHHRAYGSRTTAVRLG